MNRNNWGLHLVLLTIKKIQGRKALYSSASQQTWKESEFRKKIIYHEVLMTVTFLSFVKSCFILLVQYGWGEDRQLSW